MSENKKVQIGRPVNPEKAKRKKFTTMLDPDLRDSLKIRAIKEKKTTADLLEDIIQDYLKGK